MAFVTVYNPNKWTEKSPSGAIEGNLWADFNIILLFTKKSHNIRFYHHKFSTFYGEF